MMVVHLQFLEVGNSGYLSDKLGSDGVFILDGRQKLVTWKADAQLRMHQLKDVTRGIVGYKIMKGSRFDNDNPILYQWIRSGVQYKTKK